jgi:hypothetical protein
MNILKFIKEFPNEESCQEHFRLNREEQGLICKHCKNTKHYWLKAKCQWQCAQCNFRTTLRSGTVMHGSNLPVRKWYLAMAFMSATKKGISAKELQRQLQHTRYDTIWSLMHRIRNAMGNREAMFSSHGIVCFNQTHFLTATPDGRKLRRGKINPSEISHNRVELKDPAHLSLMKELLEPDAYWKLNVVNTTHETTQNDEKESFEEKQLTFTSQGEIKDSIDPFIEAKSLCTNGQKANKNELFWKNIILNNAKKILHGIYHKIKGKYLQLYLDEFCFKLNRRYSGEALFERLTSALAKTYWYN